VAAHAIQLHHLPLTLAQDREGQNGRKGREGGKRVGLHWSNAGRSKGVGAIDVVGGIKIVVVATVGVGIVIGGFGIDKIVVDVRIVKEGVVDDGVVVVVVVVVIVVVGGVVVVDDGAVAVVDVVVDDGVVAVAAVVRVYEVGLRVLAGVVIGMNKRHHRRRVKGRKLVIVRQYLLHKNT
jgi:hypothetical protein